MDEHQCQNQSLTVTTNFRHQSCWYCCLWPAEGTFLNVAPICHLFRGRGKKPSGSTISFRCPSIPPVFTTSHLTILGSKIFDRRSARHRLNYLRNFLSQYHYRHFVLAPWRTVSCEVKNIAVLYGTQICITVSPICPKPEPGEFSLRPFIPVRTSHLNIILSFTPTSSMFVLLFRFSTKILHTFHTA